MRLPEKKYYLSKIKDDLEYTKEADNRDRIIINKFERTGQLPNLIELVKTYDRGNV